MMMMIIITILLLINCVSQLIPWPRGKILLPCKEKAFLAGKNMLTLGRNWHGVHWVSEPEEALLGWAEAPPPATLSLSTSLTSPHTADKPWHHPPDSLQVTVPTEHTIEETLKGTPTWANPSMEVFISPKQGSKQVMGTIE